MLIVVDDYTIMENLDSNMNIGKLLCSSYVEDLLCLFPCLIIFTVSILNYNHLFVRFLRYKKIVMLMLVNKIPPTFFFSK